jgi:hypothetical protein
MENGVAVIVDITLLGGCYHRFSIRQSGSPDAWLPELRAITDPPSRRTRLSPSEL